MNSYEQQLVESLRTESSYAEAASSIGGKNWRDGMSVIAKKFAAAADAIERLTRERDDRPTNEMYRALRADLRAALLKTE